MKLLDCGDSFAFEREKSLGPFGEHLPQRRQTDLSRHAIEQLAADGCFELLNMSADGRLAQGEQLGSLGKTLMFGDPIEISNL